MRAGVTGKFVSVTPIENELHWF